MAKRKVKLTLREMVQRVLTHGRVYSECTHEEPNRFADYHEGGEVVDHEGDTELYECQDCGRTWKC